MPGSSNGNIFCPLFCGMLSPPHSDLLHGEGGASALFFQSEKVTADIFKSSFQIIRKPGQYRLSEDLSAFSGFNFRLERIDISIPETEGTVPYFIQCPPAGGVLCDGNDFFCNTMIFQRAQQTAGSAGSEPCFITDFLKMTERGAYGAQDPAYKGRASVILLQPLSAGIKGLFPGKTGFPDFHRQISAAENISAGLDFLLSLRKGGSDLSKKVRDTAGMFQKS